MVGGGHPSTHISTHALLQKNPRVRKILVCNCGAGKPILWTPGKNVFFLQENLHVHKIPRFGKRGGVLVWGGSADFLFMGAGIFLIDWVANGLVTLSYPREIVFGDACGSQTRTLGRGGSNEWGQERG